MVAADALLESMVAADRKRKSWATNEEFLRDGERLGDIARAIEPEPEPPEPPEPPAPPTAQLPSSKLWLTVRMP